MVSMKFANILLETNPRSVAYPALYCRSNQPVVFDEQLGEWKMFNAGTFDFSTYFNVRNEAAEVHARNKLHAAS